MQVLSRVMDRAAMPSRANDDPVVHIVDDDDSLRLALESLLRSVGLVTRTYGSARAFLDAKPDNQPGCLVLPWPGIPLRFGGWSCATSTM